MENQPRATLVLFCGLPGSGKTTLAKQLEQQGKGIRICTDDWQDDLKLGHADDSFHERLQRRLYQLALELLDHGQSVILEDGLWAKPEREEKLADAKSRGAAVELHLFDLSFDELWNRLATRNQNLPHGAVHIPKPELEKCWNLFQKPAPAELKRFDKFSIYKDTTRLRQAQHQ
jgi:predicted kinase